MNEVTLLNTPATIEETKTCTKCHKEHPATREFFYAEKRHGDGLHAWCKPCSLSRMEKYRKVYRATTNGHLRDVYAGMKKRCSNPNCHNYHRYGGRGIKCLFTADEFVSYVINVLQIDPHGLEIDRIDNDGHYEPGNIRFVTHSENCKNRHKGMRIK